MFSKLTNSSCSRFSAFFTSIFITLHHYTAFSLSIREKGHQKVTFFDRLKPGGSICFLRAFVLVWRVLRSKKNLVAAALAHHSGSAQSHHGGTQSGHIQHQLSGVASLSRLLSGLLGGLRLVGSLGLVGGLGSATGGEAVHGALESSHGVVHNLLVVLGEGLVGHDSLSVLESRAEGGHGLG